jgi:hypothetical protein
LACVSNSLACAGKTGRAVGLQNVVCKTAGISAAITQGATPVTNVHKGVGALLTALAAALLIGAFATANANKKSLDWNAHPTGAESIAIRKELR